MRRVLVANRAEIAVRIAAACLESGIEPVAVYSEADRGAPHTRLASRAVCIGPAPASESYLSIEALIEAARKTGCDAVHPGYGFLAENPRFAAACDAAGLRWVGPPAPVLERLGSKIDARLLAASCGVPVVPGETPVDQSDEGILRAAARIGTPLLIKASAGGGGKGMRMVTAEAQVPEAAAAARREAIAAFGDGTLYVERLIERPRHVEIQILADEQGHVVHLFERDCSVQRRHQKIIEEAPSPALTARVRARMADAALALAGAAGYVNAGTVEFLLEGEGDSASFYFLEVNARLQVEHPVTEAITGIDLVQAQLQLAAGRPLAWQQRDIAMRGHAIECRVYAEDPDAGFLPQAGPLLRFRPPSAPGVRIDTGVEEGGAVTVHYDPLLAKVTSASASRDEAIRRGAGALRRFPILGVRTNIGFLRRVLEHPAFAAARTHTGFVDEQAAALMTPPSGPSRIVAAALGARAARRSATVRGGRGTTNRADADPWDRLGGWRQTP